MKIKTDAVKEVVPVRELPEMPEGTEMVEDDFENGPIYYDADGNRLN